MLHALERPRFEPELPVSHEIGPGPTEEPVPADVVDTPSVSWPAARSASLLAPRSGDRLAPPSSGCSS